MSARLLLATATSTLIFVAYTQQKDWATRRLEMSRSYESKGLAEAFRGVTTNGTVQPNLYKLAKSGVSTEGVRKATQAFLQTLSPEQQKQTRFAVDDVEWRKWMNQDFYVRAGMGFAEMSTAQREAAFAMMRAGMSAKGLQLSRDIMHLNQTLEELTGDTVRYGEWAYWVSVMGEPSATQPWGWQVEGHHLIVNYFVLGDQVVMTPMFIGSEPVVAHGGKYQGTRILQEEQAAGLALARSLTDAQRKLAIVEAAKVRNHNRLEAFQDNAVVPYEGIAVRSLTAAQRQKLVQLTRMFIDNMDEGHARVRMEEINRYLDQTHFAWIGGTDADSVFYFRIQSPVVVIEFDHQLPVGLARFSRNPRLPERDHIHVVVRTPNGNDYGKDLLRQHLARQTH